MKVSVPVEKSYHLINHGPCSLITSGQGNEINVCPINWTMPIHDDPPLILTVVEKEIHTHRLIEKYKTFCVNIVGEHLAEAVLGCGGVSGAKVNKFEKWNLHPLPGKRIATPYLQEAIGHIECRVASNHDYEGVTLFIGPAVYAEIEENCYDSHLIPENVKTIHHIGAGWFSVTGKRFQVKR